jgi:hypothetical protein
MTLSRRELAWSASSIAARNDAATRFPLSPRVIPGRDEVASPESIHPPTLTRDGFRVCTASRRIPE